MDKIKALAERLENALTKLEINQSDASELSDAQAKLDEIQKELDAERANSKEITSKISDLEVDLEKAAAASADAALLTENHGTLEKRIEELEAEISLKDKALAAANGGGEATESVDLSSLRKEREDDLEQVNEILSKLKPLVEG